MGKTLLIFLIIVIVGIGAYFVGKKGTTTSVAPSSVSSVNPTSSPLANENELLISGVKAGLIAEHGQDAASFKITVSESQNGYAKGMANGTGGGGIWFAAKVNNNWKLVWDGNGIIQCSDLASYPNFPSSMIPQCWDTALNKLITR